MAKQSAHSINQRDHHCKIDKVVDFLGVVNINSGALLSVHRLSPTPSRRLVPQWLMQPLCMPTIKGDSMHTDKRRLLICGWFSFDLPHNTAGDLLAQRTAKAWATEAGFTCDVAVPHPIAADEVATSELKPQDYSVVVFVCGPLTASHIVPFMEKFSAARRVALNVSIVPTADLSRVFDVIIPRDSQEVTNPDISLASKSEPTPVVGLIYVGRQKEYPNQRHDAVEATVDEVVKKMGLAIVRIDTKLPHNQYGLSSIGQVESVMKHMDLVITTRLHGSVLSLRNGVPPIAIDPVPGGAKVLKQMKALDWPLVYTVDKLDEGQLREAIDTAMTKQSRELAASKVERALSELTEVETLFVDALDGGMQG